MENLLKKEETGVEKVKNFIRGNKTLKSTVDKINIFFYIWMYSLAINILSNVNELNAFETFFISMMFVLLVLQLFIILIVNPDKKRRKLKNFYAKQEIFEKSYRERGFFYRHPDLHLN